MPFVKEMDSKLDMFVQTMNDSVSDFKDFYDRMWEIRDKRVEGWPFMASPWPTIALVGFYAYFSLGLGPAFMKNRPAYQLKRPLQFYNLFQVIFSAYVFYEAAVAGWLTGYNWLCQNVDRNPDPNSNGMRMTRACWLYFMGKFIEFTDTFFFIARKKFTHVSLLQVIHHGSMPLYGYVMVRWLPGGHETFGGTLNSFIHVFMYGYYFLASLGPHMQKYLWWKKYLTIAQMVQFIIVFVRSNLVIFEVVECGYPRQFSLISATLTFVFFCLFMNFYKSAYMSNKGSRAKKFPKTLKKH